MVEKTVLDKKELYDTEEVMKEDALETSGVNSKLNFAC